LSRKLNSDVAGKPVLQIALDLTDLFEAVELAVKVSSTFTCKSIWFEAGTPLIKSWGRLAVKAIKEATGCFTVADAKIMDTGGLEAEILFKAGADAVTVLGVADNETIREALNKAREYGKVLIADLISHPKPYERALELADMGVDVVLYHIGIDVQKRRGLTALDLIEELRSLRKAVSNKIAVAGGIKHGSAKLFAEIGVDIIVVGGAIVKAADPLSSTRMFLQELGLL